MEKKILLVLAGLALAGLGIAALFALSYLSVLAGEEEHIRSATTLDQVSAAASSCDASWQMGDVQFCESSTLFIGSRLDGSAVALDRGYVIFLRSGISMRDKLALLRHELCHVEQHRRNDTSAWWAQEMECYGKQYLGR